MRKFTEMRFFHLSDYISRSDPDLPILKTAYTEFVNFLYSESETTNNLTAFYNQLINAKIELESLMNDEQIKLVDKRIPIFNFLEKARKQINEQQKHVKWRIKHNYKIPIKHDPSAKTGTKVVWTGTPFELVELGYALFATKCFNNGELEIKELMQFLFRSYSFEVKNYYHKYTTIRKRTSTIDRTIFLDKMKRFFTRKMDEDDNRKKRRE